MADLRSQGVTIAVVDAISNDDLHRMGPALKDLALVTAGSGVAIGLPANFGIAPSNTASDLPPPTGFQAVVSGSCSLATNRQVQAFMVAGYPTLAIDPLTLVGHSEQAVSDALKWAQPFLDKRPVLIYSSASPEAVKAVQAQLGVQAAGDLVEHTLAAIARGLVEGGVRQLVVAGGETSGACVQALGITQMKIGPQIDPGVPWCHACSDAAPDGGLHLTLKSGNFGTDDFFIKSFGCLG
jgi:uncharacterized protein YgbK (DUF1537 family)